MLTKRFPRVQLAHLPTPLEALPRLRQHLSEELGQCPRLLIKRDDQTGLATGGNKTRKLEFLVADALEQGADTLITTGAGQSNHCRQTAAAAARFGLRCVLVLGGEEPPVRNGNLLLDDLLGAEIRWVDQAIRNQAIWDVGEELRGSGAKPYVIPVGGSVAIGALGYVAAMEELQGQLKERDLHIDRIAGVSSSGGTHAGMLVGSYGLHMNIPIEGLHNDLPDDFKQTVRVLTDETLAFMGIESEVTIPDEAIILHEAGHYAYGTITDQEQEAMRLMARTEGIILDPIYTGRGFGEVLKRIRAGAYAPEEHILFWHTGGTSGLFARAEELVDRR